MNTTYSISMGDRGRLVVPAELRERQHWEQGTPLVLIETEDGVLFANRSKALELIRGQLAGPSLADELANDRREASRRDDVS